MMPPLVALLLVAFVTTSFVPEHTVAGDVAKSGCVLSSLREEFVIDDCDSEPNILERGHDAVTLGTRCTIRCAAGAGTSHRECVAGGFWDGPRFNCHIPSSDTDGAQPGVKRSKRGFWAVVLPVVAPYLFEFATCVLVDDILHWKSCDNGGGKGDSAPDSTPPAIKCFPPKNTPVIADEGRCDASVSWHDATASDSSGIRSIVQTLPAAASSGSKFREGVHIVMYVATDNTGLTSTCTFQFEVEAMYCASPRRPRHGEIDCETNSRCGNGYTYGTKCTASCQEGYTMTGYPKKTCRRNGQWLGEDVTCSRKACPRLTPSVNADIQCSDTSLYRSTCITVCKEGFRLSQSGKRSVTCRDDQTWSGILSGCEDKERPEFTECPFSVRVNVGQDGQTAIATWPTPVVTDNVDIYVVPRLTKGMAPGARFTLGEHDIEYRAEDAAHNDAIPCRFTVTVGMIPCPSIQWSRKMKTVSCPQGLAYGASCTFACVAGYDMIGEDKVTCERGEETSAFGVWSSEPPKCSVKECKKLEPPKNGALAWENWMFGIQSRIYCSDKYDVPRGTSSTEYYVCDDSKGTWSPSDIVPDCTAKHNAEKVRLRSKLQYYSGDCTTKEAQRYIKHEFITALNSSTSYNVLCRAFPACGVDNVLVECGEVTRRKRDTLRVNRDSTHNVQIAFDFFIKLREESNVDATKLWVEIDDTLTKMKDSVRQSIDGGRLNLTIRDLPIQIKPDSFEAVDSEAQLRCPPGSLPRDDSFTCGVCSTRTYYDSSSDSCVDCPVGSYNDKENQTTCTQCPDGTSTLTKGSRDMDNCIAMCPAGSYSDTGLVPCAQCAVGSYQPQTNTKTCTPCPHGSVTSKTGSVALQDCLVNTNNCDPDPCGGYRCEDTHNDFVCHCKGGFTGKTCQIPPDYCANNLCLNGASCLPGRANYSCRCASGYRGTLCDDDIVNGGYGPWSAWSSCTKTCEGGVQARSRQCNDPVPDPDGQACIGPSSEIRDCNVDKCPECSQFVNLPGLHGTIVNCSQEDNGNIMCHVTCKPGMESSQLLTIPYFCGPKTNYIWSHMLNQPTARLPDCSNSAVPSQVALRVQVAYNATNPDQLTPAKTKFTNLTDKCDCIHTGICNVTTAVGQIVGTTSDTLTTTARPVVQPAPGGRIGGFELIVVVVGSTVHGESYGPRTYKSSNDDAVARWNNIVNNLETLASLIVMAKENGSLCITLAGDVYCPINGSLLLQGVQICPSPMVMSFDGSRCVNCPPGTRSERMRCVACAQGQYQDNEGQTRCKSCPANTTTAQPGAASVDECKAMTTTTTSGTTTTTTTTAKTMMTATKDDTVSGFGAIPGGFETDVQHAKYAMVKLAAAVVCGIVILLVVMGVVGIVIRRRRYPLWPQQKLGPVLDLKPGPEKPKCVDGEKAKVGAAQNYVNEAIEQSKDENTYETIADTKPGHAVDNEYSTPQRRLDESKNP